MNKQVTETPKKLGKRQTKHDKKMFNTTGEIKSCPNGTLDLRALADRLSTLQIQSMTAALNKELEVPFDSEDLAEHSRMFMTALKQTLPSKYHTQALAEFSAVNAEYIKDCADSLSRVSVQMSCNNVIHMSNLSSKDMLGRPLYCNSVSRFDQEEIELEFPVYLSLLNEAIRL